MNKIFHLSTLGCILSSATVLTLITCTNSTVATNSLSSSQSNYLRSEIRIAGTLEDQVKAAIDAKIKAAVESKDPDKKLEGDVANMLVNNGYKVIKFGEKYYKSTGELEGEIDIETTKVIVEVTTVASGKKSQIEKYMTSTTLNPLKKPIILYAPNYTDTPAKDITALGAYVIKKPSDLFAKMTELGGK